MGGGGGACNHKSNLTELKWEHAVGWREESQVKRKLKLVAIGNFLAQHLPLATCLMPHGRRQRAECVVATRRQLQLPQLTGLISTHTQVDCNFCPTELCSNIKSTSLSHSLPVSLSLFCQGCQPFGLPITVMIAAHTHILTHTQKQYEINLPQGKIENEKEPKAKRNIEKEESLVSTCRRLNTLLQPMPIIYIIIQIYTI